MKGIAAKYNKSVAQLVLRWHLQHGFLPLPKSVHAKYIQSNTDIFDFEISDVDMAAMDGMRGAAGLIDDPDKVPF